MSVGGVMDRSGGSPERGPRRGATQAPQDELDNWMRYLTLGQRHLVESVRRTVQMYFQANNEQQRSQHHLDLTMYHKFCLGYKFHERLMGLLFEHRNY